MSVTVTFGRLPVATRPFTVRATPVLAATVTVRVPEGATVTLIGIGLDPPAFRLPLGLTDSFTTGDVEPPNEAEFDGVNTAVSGNVPADGNEVVVVAVPVASTAMGVLLIAVEPFMNVTEPAGWVPSVAISTAVRVTLPPALVGLGDAASVVLVPVTVATPVVYVPVADVMVMSVDWTNSPLPVPAPALKHSTAHSTGWPNGMLVPRD